MIANSFKRSWVAAVNSASDGSPISSIGFWPRPAAAPVANIRQVSLVEVRVSGAMTDADARRVGLSIANSPLVKTAIAGEDPNWGRVVMAVGKSGEAADRDNLSIWFGHHAVAEQGERAAGYDEPTIAAYMKARQIDIRVDVGVGGPGRATIWTCDLTQDYFLINADYRS